MVARKPHILILEDDPEWVDAIARYLDEYIVFPASTLHEARNLLNRQVLDLAIVDISLVLGNSGDEKGLRFIEELRTTDILRDISIIIVTAYPSEARIRKAFRDYGVHDFIDKMTIDPQEFKQEVAKAIAISEEIFRRSS